MEQLSHTRSRPFIRVLAALTSAVLVISALLPGTVSAVPVGPTNADIRTLQNDLNGDLVKWGMPALDVDGRLGPLTLRALCVERWLTGEGATRSRAGITKESIQAWDQRDNLAVPNEQELYNTKIGAGFIINKTCQVLIAVGNQTIAGVIPASTGIPGHETSNGVWQIYFARYGWHNSSRYPSETQEGNMFHPLYYKPGQEGKGAEAIHGSRDMNDRVTRPMSHGCVRVNEEDAWALLVFVGGINQTTEDNKPVNVASLPVIVAGGYEHNIR